MTTGVPTMMYMILQEKELLAAADTGSVRTISMGSAPCSESLLNGLAAAFPQAEIHLNYGTTEGGPIMLGWYHTEGKPRPRHSVGYPIPGCDYRFVGGPHARRSPADGGPRARRDPADGGPRARRDRTDGGPHARRKRIVGGPHARRRRVVGGK